MAIDRAAASPGCERIRFRHRELRCPSTIPSFNVQLAHQGDVGTSEIATTICTYVRFARRHGDVTVIEVENLHCRSGPVTAGRWRIRRRPKPTAMCRRTSNGNGSIFSAFQSSTRSHASAEFTLPQTAATQWKIASERKC
jgi:hypothetical protein